MKSKLQTLAKLLSSYDLRSSHEVNRLAVFASPSFDLLILVHPDGVVDRGVELAEKYLDALKQHIGKFDKVITHFMFSYEYLSMPSTKELKIHDILKEIRGYLEVNTEHKFDMSLGKESFENDISEILMDNPNLNIFLAGGNQDLCLQSSYENFCDVLGWLVDEQNHSVRVYSPLVYHQKYWGDYDDKIKDYVGQKPEGLGLRLPGGRVREYPGQIHYPDERYTEEEPWFKGLEFSDLDDKIAGRYDKIPVSRPIKMQPAYEYIMYLKLMRGLDDATFHHMKRKYLNTSQQIQEECRQELNKLIQQDALAGELSSSEIRRRFSEALAKTSFDPKIAQSTYKVKPGDSFYSIANGDPEYQRLIEEANPGVDPAKLQIGQAIVLPPKPSKPNASMNPSGRLVAFIKKHEGKPNTGEPYLIPYDDGFGNVTAGWGHNYGKGDPKRYLNLTHERAEELLAEDLEEAASFVRRNVKVKLTQGQFDALTSLVFNAGGTAVYNTDLFEAINSGNFGEAKKLFPRTLVGKNQGGLVERRQGELTLFIS